MAVIGDEPCFAGETLRLVEEQVAVFDEVGVGHALVPHQFVPRNAQRATPTPPVDQRAPISDPHARPALQHVPRGTTGTYSALIPRAVQRTPTSSIGQQPSKLARAAVPAELVVQHTPRVVLDTRPVPAETVGRPATAAAVLRQKN